MNDVSIALAFYNIHNRLPLVGKYEPSSPYIQFANKSSDRDFGSVWPDG